MDFCFCRIVVISKKKSPTSVICQALVELKNDVLNYNLLKFYFLIIATTADNIYSRLQSLNVYFIISSTLPN